MRERVIKNYEAGMLKKEIIDIFIIGSDTLNRWIRKYKETGNTEPCKRTKYRAKKFSDDALLNHVLKNPSSTLEERALFFSVKHQSVHSRIKALWITRKKTFFYEERDESQRNEFSEKIAKENENIVYIDESGIKNTLRNEYAWPPRGESVNDKKRAMRLKN